MRKLSAVWFVLGVIVQIASAADWQIVSSNQETRGVAGIEHLHVATENARSGDEADLHLAIFSSKTATLRVVDQASDQRQDLAEVMEKEGCVAGVNGGYFDPEYAPVGLLVADGRPVAALRKARLLSGVVRVVNGRVQLLRTSEFSAMPKTTAARQCGPFLVDKQKPVAGLDDTRSARRTFVLTGAADRVAIGLCSSITLAQLAAILSTPGLAPDLKVQRALNLDGGSSSAFWFRGRGDAFSISEWKPVRDFLTVVPK